MRNVHDLMIRLCPNGVEYRQIQEIFELENGCRPVNIDRNLIDYEVVPWFQLSDIDRNGLVLDKSVTQLVVEDINKIQPSPANSIIISIFASITKHALIKVPHKADSNFITLVLKPNYFNQVDIRFVNYYCFVLDRWCTAKKNEAFAHSLNIDEFKCFKFPVPPLPVQKEIVSFLDNFTNLEAELEAELTARRQQFAFYINALFAFDESGEKSRFNSANWQTLGDVGKFISGNGEVNGNYSDSGVGFIHSKHIINEFDVVATQTKKYISESRAKNLNKARKGDLIIANKSVVDDEVCKAVAWLGDEDVVAGKDTYIYRHTLDPKFVAYYFKTNQFLKQKRSLTTGLIHGWISDRSMCDIKIPVPPQNVQERIVALLDGFDLLLNDDSGSLPAELTARRKQHEYYRNKVLSFKEAA